MLAQRLERYILIPIPEIPGIIFPLVHLPRRKSIPLEFEKRITKQGFHLKEPGEKWLGRLGEIDANFADEERDRLQNEINPI